MWKAATTALLVAGIYLNANYVTVQKFESAQGDNATAHARITEVLAQVNTSVSLLQQNHKIIEDIRVRQQQSIVDIADLKARVVILEKKP